jgi:hypothetical protein
MDTFREKVCCDELPVCSEKKDDAVIHYNKEEAFKCITEHPSFQLNCLQWEILDVAWNIYRRQYGARAYESNNKNKRYRHIAYRQLACVLFGTVGRYNRYILPSCAVNKIRGTFSNADEIFIGFMPE